MGDYAILGAEPEESVADAIKRLHNNLIDRDYVIGLEAELAEANRRNAELTAQLQIAQRPGIVRKIVDVPIRVLKRVLR